MLSDFDLRWLFLLLLKKLPRLSDAVSSFFVALNWAVANSSALALLGIIPFCTSWLLRPKVIHSVTYKVLLHERVLFFHEIFDSYEVYILIINKTQFLLLIWHSTWYHWSHILNFNNFYYWTIQAWLGGGCSVFSKTHKANSG